MIPPLSRVKKAAAWATLWLIGVPLLVGAVVDLWRASGGRS